MVNAVKLAQEHLVLETLGLKLTPEFIKVLDAEPRELLVFGGWRAGKSTSAAAKVMKRIPFWKMENAATSINPATQKTALVWLVAPDYKRANAEFDILKDWLARLNWLEFGSGAMEGPRQIRVKGVGKPAVIIDTRSAAHPESLSSVAPDYILGCESGAMSEETRLMLKGRASEKRCNIAFTGTIEDEETHEMWAWYPELGGKWLNEAKCELEGERGHVCAIEHNAVSLPTWANTAQYPLGREDPEIIKNEQDFYAATGSHFTFNRRFAGIPTGLPYQVYPVLDSRDFRVSFDDLRDLLGAEPRAIAGFGGIDFGDVHPSSITVAHLYPDSRDDDPKFVGPRGILVVRENWFNDQDPGNTAKLHQARKELSQRYKVYRWATDPNERYMANDTGAEAVSGSRRSREYRISLVNTRLSLGKLYYLRDSSGIDDLYEEQRRVHRRKQSDGQLVLVRLLDDRTASLEDVVELVDGKPRGRVPKPSSISRRPASPRRQTYRRIA